MKSRLCCLVNGAPLLGYSVRVCSSPLYSIYYSCCSCCRSLFGLTVLCYHCPAAIWTLCRPANEIGLLAGSPLPCWFSPSRSSRSLLSLSSPLQQRPLSTLLPMLFSSPYPLYVCFLLQMSQPLVSLRPRVVGADGDDVVLVGGKLF